MTYFCLEIGTRGRGIHKIFVGMYENAVQYKRVNSVWTGSLSLGTLGSEVRDDVYLFVESRDAVRYG